MSARRERRRRRHLPWTISLANSQVLHRTQHKRMDNNNWKSAFRIVHEGLGQTLVLYALEDIICSISIGIVWCVTVRCPRLPVRIGGAWLGRPPTNIWLAISLLLNAQLIIYRDTHTHTAPYICARDPRVGFLWICFIRIGSDLAHPWG